jgi:hypothetical protein
LLIAFPAPFSRSAPARPAATTGNRAPTPVLGQPERATG